MPKSRLGSSRANSLRAAPILQLVLVGSIALGIGWLGYSRSDETAMADASTGVIQEAMQDIQNSGPGKALTAARAEVAEAVAPILIQPQAMTREAELDEGQTIAELLTSAGASQSDATAAMNALSKVYDLRLMRAGQDISLSFLRTAQQETFTGAIFQPEATKEVIIARNDTGAYTANVKLIPVARQRLAAKAEISSSLYEAGDKAGVPHAIMASLIRIYSHDIDFQRDIHPGDKFEVLYDQPMTSHGKAVGEGEIIYAALNVGGKTKPVYRVIFNDKTADYFDELGHSIRRALLRTPVAAAHITSGFGMRMHPLLGYSKMHQGIDFGAPTGTPIFAAGNGVVEEQGFKNGYGRYIRIRHNGKMSTAYAHMSRFANKLYRGARVTQGEVIGYVGASGRVTGPHLHYEVVVNGKQVNPMSINLPTGRILEGKMLADFKAGQKKIKSEFSTMIAQNVTPRGFIPAASSQVAFPKHTVQACGLRGC